MGLKSHQVLCTIELKAQPETLATHRVLGWILNLNTSLLTKMSQSSYESWMFGQIHILVSVQKLRDHISFSIEHLLILKLLTWEEVEPSEGATSGRHAEQMLSCSFWCYRWITAIKASIKKWLPLHQALQDYMNRPPEETRMWDGAFTV